MRKHLPSSRPRKKPVLSTEPADIAAELNDLLSQDHIQPSLKWLIGTPPAVPSADETSGDVPTQDVPSPQTAQPVSDITSPDAASPDASTPVVAEIASDRPGLGITSPDVSSPDIPAPDETIPVVASRLALSGVRKVHRCASVQDGHSSTEQLVYDLMWRAGRPVDADVRHFQLPLEALAWKVKIAERNLRPLLQRLVQKRSLRKVTEPDRGRKIPAAYHVYSYRRILALRKEAGLEYVVRSKGVEFIPREQALALEAERAAARERLFAPEDITSPDDTSPDDSSPVEISPVDSKTSGHAPSPLYAVTSPDVSGKTSPDGASPPTLLGHYSSGQQPTAAHFLPAGLARQLRQLAGDACTDAAAARLWHECRRRAPDCTPEEVLHFSGVHLASLHNRTDVGNPVGLLLTAVPQFFEGGTLGEYRLQKGREDADAQRLDQENRRYFEELARDPQASAEDRAWAESMLETLRKPDLTRS